MSVPESARSAFDEAFGDKPRVLDHEDGDYTAQSEADLSEAATASPRRNVPNRIGKKIDAGLHPSPMFDVDSPKETTLLDDALPELGADINILEDERMLHPKEVARYLGTTVDTLAQWRARGTGPVYYKAKGNGAFGRIRYLMNDLIQWRVDNYERFGPRKVQSD